MVGRIFAIVRGANMAADCAISAAVQPAPLGEERQLLGAAPDEADFESVDPRHKELLALLVALAAPREAVDAGPDALAELSRRDARLLAQLAERRLLGGHAGLQRATRRDPHVAGANVRAE